jgi:hypothetical protein
VFYNLKITLLQLCDVWKSTKKLVKISNMYFSGDGDVRFAPGAHPESFIGGRGLTLRLYIIYVCF